MRYYTVANLNRALKWRSDGKVCRIFERLLQSYNCDAAAKGYMGSLSRICASRPHLLDQLVHIPADCLFQLGIVDIDGAVAWMQHYLSKPYSLMCQDAGAIGVEWLKSNVHVVASAMEPHLTRLEREFQEEEAAEP